MARRSSVRLRFAALLAIAGAASPVYGVILADLQTDWSDSNNPNPGPFGTWSYTQGGSPLPFVANWAGAPGSSLSGWGPAANAPGNFLPFFFRSTMPFGDTLPGDVLVHSTDQANGGPNGPAQFLWTSGVTDSVTISGRLWPNRLLGRANDYQLVLIHNGTPAVLDSGQIVEDGSISRCVPIRFRIPGLSIVSGDVLKLQITQDPGSPFGDFAGVTLSVSNGSPNACPHPGGDLNNDGLRDGIDIAHFVNCLLHGASPCADCSCSDMNSDGVTDLRDLPDFVAALL